VPILCVTHEDAKSIIIVILYQPFDAHCCHMGTAIKHPVPDRVNLSFVIFDIRALCDAQGRAPECPDVKNYK